jgi:ATP-binding protein involved in chromosome partitioning
LNFVKDLKINQERSPDRLTTACPVRDELKAASVRAIKENVEGVVDVDITMTSNVLVHGGKQKTQILPGVKNTVAVASGKGGVGKSTVAVNIAVALAQDGAKVGLVDTDVYGPSIPLMMGITGRPMMRNQKIVPLEKFGISVMSIGFLIDATQAVIWRGPMASGAVKQFMSDVEWGDLDYLILDLPPGTGDVQLTTAQTIPLTGAVIVTTPQDVSLSDVRKGIRMFEKVNVPVLGIVENMSYYICSHCGHRDEIFDHGGGERAAEEFKTAFLGAIPIHTPIRVSGDKGNPIVLDGTDQAGRSFFKIARNMAAQVSIRNVNQISMPEITLMGDSQAPVGKQD